MPRLNGTATFSEGRTALNLSFNASQALLLNRDDIAARVTGPLQIRSDGQSGTISGDLKLNQARFQLGRASAAAAVPRLQVRERGLGPEEVIESADLRPWRLALKLRQWSADVVWCADGDSEVDDDLRADLAAAGVVVRTERVRRLEGRDGRLERIMLEDADPVERSALFLVGEQRQGSPLAERLGCRFNAKGTVETGRAERTDVPGVFVAGDA